MSERLPCPVCGDVMVSSVALCCFDCAYPTKQQRDHIHGLLLDEARSQFARVRWQVLDEVALAVMPLFKVTEPERLPGSRSEPYVSESSKDERLIERAYSFAETLMLVRERRAKL